MEEFKLKKAFLISKCMGIGYPAIAIIGLLVIVSSDFMELSDKGPLILVALFAWMGYEIYNAVKHFKYKVSVNDQQIQIKSETPVPWSQITKAQLNGMRFGMDPVIVLTKQDNQNLNIPASIDGLHFIKGFVEKHVSNIQQETV